MTSYISVKKKGEEEKNKRDLLLVIEKAVNCTAMHRVNDKAIKTSGCVELLQDASNKLVFLFIMLSNLLRED